MAKAALILIDLINEIIDEKGKFAGHGYPAQVGQRGLLAKANTAIAKARSKGVEVIFVRVGFSAGYGDCPEFSPLFGAAKQYQALQLGTWATEIHPALQRHDDDLVVTKPRVSALYGTPLEAILRAKGIDTVMIGGVATDMAVQTTARDAHDRDYKVVVLEDLCAASTDEEHQAVIAALGKIARVATSDSVAELA